MTTRPIVFQSKCQIKIRKCFFQKTILSSKFCSGPLEYRLERHAECFFFRVPSWYKRNTSLRWTTFSSTCSIVYNECSFSNLPKVFRSRSENYFSKKVSPKFLFLSRIFLWTSRLHFWQPSQGLLSVVPRKVALFLENIKKYKFSKNKFPLETLPRTRRKLFDIYADSLSLKV